MRNTALLWLVLAIFCSGALFYVSQKTHNMKQDLVVVTKDIAQEQEAIRVLEAEWSYLNNPKRLERLTKKYLKTDVMRLDQFVQEDGIKVANSYIVKAPVVRIAAKPVKLKSKKLAHAKAAVARHKKKEMKTISIAKNTKHSFRQLIREWGNE